MNYKDKKGSINIGGFMISPSPFNRDNYWLQCNDGEGMEINKDELNKKLNSIFWELF